MYAGIVTGILMMQTELKVSLNYCITNLQYGRRCYCIVTAIDLVVLYEDLMN